MELWSRLEITKKPILLYGMGNGADQVIRQLENRHIPVAGVFASDGFVRHQIFHGFTVLSYGEAKKRFGDMVVLLAFGTQRPEVLTNIKGIMEEQELYVPDLPVVGEGLWTMDYLTAHEKVLQRVDDLLADDRSRKVFRSVIEGKITGDPARLMEAESGPEEGYALLELNQEERYLDLGAYTGDTVLRFLNHVEGYRKIIAVEPDRKNYQKLVQRVGGLPGVTCCRAGVDRDAGALRFPMDGGRKSRAGEAGGAEVPSMTVDQLLQGEPVTFIKMDVEGMERAVLEGAAETIRHWKPKMEVAAYHRVEDLFDLPLLIHSLVPDVRVYLRHFPYLPAWDTNFYFKF